MKRTALIDLDGVLNKYNGKFDPNFIPEPREDVQYFLQKMSENFNLQLFTTRNKLLASKWLIENHLDKYFEDVTNIKNPAWIMIDDRCLTFKGDFDEILKRVNEFEVWYK